MKRFFFLGIAILGLFSLYSCRQSQQSAVFSPNNNIRAEVLLTPDGQAAYRVMYKKQMVLDTSLLGMDFQGQAPLAGDLRIVNVQKRSFSEDWQTVWGDYEHIRNAFNELRVDLEEVSGLKRKFSIEFRAFDDGVAFRYLFPEQEALDSVVILAERTQFQLTGDHQVWWQPGDWDIYEHLYSHTRFSEIDALSYRSHVNLAQTYIPENAVNTPVTMKTDDGLYLSFHEAALYDYSSMTLRVNKEALRWEAALVASADSVKVKTRAPFQTPWRTVQIAEKAGDLIESCMILNLNAPNTIEDVSWIKPAKYVGIWWEMHLGKSSWDMAGINHGATTANAKRYIDFAAANNMDAVLIEGWNTGWEDWWDQVKRETCFDFVTPYADFDLQEVLRYGREKGVQLISHHETASAVTQYEKQLDTAYQQLEKLGIHAVKTGYVGTIIPKGEYHQGQWMVNHFQRVVELAARHKVMVDAHETIKDTGIRRTWPNFMAREVFRGQEFNAWASDGGNPPNHLPTLVYTIMLGGPMDYTPGIFNIKFAEYKKDNQVNTTLAQQLALYVVLSSPLQMAADLVEHYEGQPAFQFIRDVPVNWSQMRVLAGEVGEYAVIAKKDRHSSRWFLGAIADEQGKVADVSLSFLPAGKRYKATFYEDGPKAHWNDNPLDLIIRSQEVSSGDKLSLRLASGGGVAISFEELK